MGNNASIEGTEPKAIEAGSSTGTSIDMEQEIKLPKWRLIVLSICLCMGLFMSFLDASIISTALFTIGEEFGALSSINWVALAYTLSDVGCAVLFTSFGDVIGRRNAYIVAYLMFLAFSLACGWAQTINQLIVLRALQGIGGSGLYSLAMVIFPEIAPQVMKKYIGAIAGGVVGIAGVMGPILGGIITHYSTWRWIFWLNAPVCVLGLAGFILAWPNEKQMRHAERKPMREMDILGSFLLIAASVLVVFSFQESGVHNDSWGKPIFIAPVAAGAVCWVVLFGWEYSIARFWKDSVAALFPSDLFKRRVYLAAALTTLFTGFPYFVVIFNVPLHFQVVNGKDTLASGIGLLPLLGATAIGSSLGGGISAMKDNTFYTLTVGSSLLTLGIGLLSTISGSESVDPKLYGYQVLVGMGFGLSVSTSSILAAIECDLKDHATSQGVIAQARVLGGSFGIAASTAILGVVERRQLRDILSPAQIASMDFSSLDNLQRQAVRQAYSNAFSRTLQISAIISGISILFTLFAFKKNPVSLKIRSERQLAEEIERQRTKRLKSTGGLVIPAFASPDPEVQLDSSENLELANEKKEVVENASIERVTLLPMQISPTESLPGSTLEPVDERTVSPAPGSISLSMHERRDIQLAKKGSTPSIASNITNSSNQSRVTLSQSPPSMMVKLYGKSDV